MSSLLHISLLNCVYLILVCGKFNNNKFDFEHQLVFRKKWLAAQLELYGVQAWLTLRVQSHYTLHSKFTFYILCEKTPRYIQTPHQYAMFIHRQLRSELPLTSIFPGDSNHLHIFGDIFG